jgi:aspartate racemase
MTHMKKIGLIGGLGWESSMVYYRILNLEANRRFGGKHAARVILYSLDFGEVEKLVSGGDDEGLISLLAGAAVNLEKAGAGLLAFCANTPHLYYDEVKKQVGVPMVHIARPAAEAVRQMNLKKVALLGTRLTMEKGFIRDIIAADSGAEVIIPDEPDRTTMHNIIYDELVIGRFTPQTKESILHIIDTLAGKGAEGILLACTDFTLIINPGDHMLPLFDTTRLHALAILEAACK